MNLAERLTRRSLFKVTGESVALSDRDTVQRWMRELRPGRDQMVLIHRPWGSVAAVADRRPPVNVFLSDGERTWFAADPGATTDQNLTPDQIEYIMLDSLMSPGPPDWPEWRDL